MSFSEMCKLRAQIRELEKQVDKYKADAELGSAVKLAFENTDKALFLAHWQDGEDGEFYVLEEKSFEFDSEQDLIEWYRKKKEVRNGE